MSKTNTDPLAPFEIQLFGKTYNLSPRADLEIDEGNLIQLMMDQPAIYAYYSVIADEAQNTVEAWQVALQQKESELYDRILEEGTVKQTEDPMKKAIRGHEDYHEVQENLVNASMLAAKMKSLVNAFADRRFILIAIAMKTGISMYQEGAINSGAKYHTPKPVAVEQHRTVGAFPGKKKGVV